MFIRRLEVLQELAGRKGRVTGTIENPVFLPGQQHLRWGRFKNTDPDVMFQTVGEQVFPFLRPLGGDESILVQNPKIQRRFFRPVRLAPRRPAVYGLLR